MERGYQEGEWKGDMMKKLVERGYDEGEWNGGGKKNVNSGKENEN